MTWTKEQTDKLLELRASGMSGSQIGKQIGKSRSAVEGKLWRMKGGKTSTGYMPQPSTAGHKKTREELLGLPPRENTIK